MKAWIEHVVVVGIVALVATGTLYYMNQQTPEPDRSKVPKIQRVNYTHEEIQDRLNMCFAPEDTSEVMQQQGYNEFYSDTVEYHVLKNEYGGE